MVLAKDPVCLGPFTPKQKLYLETDDGVVMEGQFFKFTSSKKAIILHRAELIPPDGRVFSQYQATLSDLVCLRPLEPVKEAVDETSRSVERSRDGASSSPKTAEDKPRSPRIVEPSNNENRAPSNVASPSSSEGKPSPPGYNRRQQVVKALQQFAAAQGSPPPSTGHKENSSGEKNREHMNGSHDTKLSHAREARGRGNAEAERTPNTPSENSTLTAPVIKDHIYDEMKKKVMRLIVIDQLGEEFQKAMRDIVGQSLLGVGSHGAEQGRRNQVSYLSFVTEKAVYLFDMQTLGKTSWQAGFRQVLESTACEKVIFDCRLLSDCLMNTHGVNLTNVYDVQAADCIIRRCQAGKFIGRGRSLQELVAQYLYVPAALLANNVQFTNYKVWYQRPLPTGCLEYAAWQVVFLPLLRSAIDSVYRAPLTNSFSVFLDALRPLRGSEAYEAQSKIRQLPTHRLEKPFTRDNY